MTDEIVDLFCNGYTSKPLGESDLLTAPRGRDALVSYLTELCDDPSLDEFSIAIVSLHTDGSVKHCEANIVDNEVWANVVNFTGVPAGENQLPEGDHVNMHDIYTRLTDGLFLTFNEDDESHYIEQDGIGSVIVRFPLTEEKKCD